MALARSGLLALFLAAACADPNETLVTRATTVTFDPAGRDYWSLPMPSELRKQPDGSYGFQRYPNPKGDRASIALMWLKAADRRLRDGWGVSSAVFFTFSGAIDSATLDATADASRSKDAAAFLVDIDPASPEYGRRFPLWEEFTADAIPYAPGNLLSLMPVNGFVRRPSTLYAAVVTDKVKDTSGQPVGRSSAFHDAWLKGEAFKELRAFYEKEKLPKERVVAATVFKTYDPSAILVKLIDWIEKQPEPAVVGEWKVEEDYQTFQLLTNRYTVPKVQNGDLPGHGFIEYDGAGAPKQSGSQQVRLSLSIPKKPMPPGGFPLMIYFHGSGGEFREPIDRGPRAVLPKKDAPQPAPGTGPAEWLARRGVAAMGFDFPLHGDRKSPPDTTGLELYNLFGDIDGTVDNMQVGVMEVDYLTRLVPKIAIPASLATSLSATGATTIKLDATKLSGMGHSMGATFGIPIASVSKRFGGFVFSGAGGTLTEVAVEATEPTQLKPALELLLDPGGKPFLKHNHPLLHVFQNLWDYVDPTAKARYVAREPRPGMQPKPFFLPQGVRDGYFHPLAQQAVAVALGAGIGGTVVNAPISDALKLSGVEPITFPAHNNLNGVTAGITQFEVPYDLGHYVAFDREDTRYQYTCFVSQVGSAGGPKLPAPGKLDDACP